NPPADFNTDPIDLSRPMERPSPISSPNDINTLDGDAILNALEKKSLIPFPMSVTVFNSSVAFSFIPLINPWIMFLPISNKLIFLRNDSALFHMFVIAFLVSSILLNTASLSCWNFWDTTSLIRSVIVLKNAFISSQLSYINLAMIPIGPVIIARIVVPHFLKKSDIPFQMETDIFLIPS